MFSPKREVGDEKEANKTKTKREWIRSHKAFREKQNYFKKIAKL